MYVPVAEVLRVPELYAEIVPVPSILSVQVAPESENVAHERTFTVPDPTRVTTGATVSTTTSCTLIVRRILPVFPATSTLRYSIV